MQESNALYTTTQQYLHTINIITKLNTNTQIK